MCPQPLPLPQGSYGGASPVPSPGRGCPQLLRVGCGGLSPTPARSDRSPLRHLRSPADCIWVDIDVWGSLWGRIFRE